jgi:hypothetical protein
MERLAVEEAGRTLNRIQAIMRRLDRRQSEVDFWLPFIQGFPRSIHTSRLPHTNLGSVSGLAIMPHQDRKLARIARAHSDANPSICIEPTEPIDH